MPLEVFFFRSGVSWTYSDSQPSPTWKTCRPIKHGGDLRHGGDFPTAAGENNTIRGKANGKIKVTAPAAVKRADGSWAMDAEREATAGSGPRSVSRPVAGTAWKRTNAPANSVLARRGGGPFLCRDGNLTRGGPGSRVYPLLPSARSNAPLDRGSCHRANFNIHKWGLFGVAPSSNREPCWRKRVRTFTTFKFCVEYFVSGLEQRNNGILWADISFIRFLPYEVSTFFDSKSLGIENTP